MHYDVFNGDADGILALLQLRLADPKDSTLITGVKRDISLLKQVDTQQASSVTVLDVSMEKNIDALEKLLERQIPVFYADHHRAPAIPQSSYLHAMINTSPDVCTGLLVNDHLKGKYYLWAIAAAFGDNLKASALRQAKLRGVSESLAANLEQLGIYINYNGYGRSIEDLHFHPAQLYKMLLNFENPEPLFTDKESIFYQLQQAYHQDMGRAESAQVLFNNDHCKVVCLEDAAWSRRVSGVFGNDLANQSPDKAHAVFTKNIDDSFTISVRAPLNNKQGADEICVQFPTGGGRAGAAGVNALPAAQLEEFIQVFSDYYK
ncbi:DHHA1 domain-containing protein [Thalassotalea mangrovi]|uniref:DHH family phosphoesterase n=1 Tax=Thalassotalea mangrovi TaxID=2572245 RepID=A0A4U1B4G9_9GAMM|nr:DHHA1 domain-containing protein [Thalassotalea mangrovi]TKB45180.1 DHH family phosphoesterase [Thalassotalea mangrovi]